MKVPKPSGPPSLTAKLVSSFKHLEEDVNKNRVSETSKVFELNEVSQSLDVLHSFHNYMGIEESG